MAEELDAQAQTFNKIGDLCTNISKDGPSRKTVDYLTKRLVTLENLWKEFEERHKNLIELENKSHAYFIENIYEKSRGMFEETKKKILKLLCSAGMEQEERTRLEETVGSNCDSAEMHARETSRKIAEKMSQQKSNFRALERSFSRINVKELQDKREVPTLSEFSEFLGGKFISLENNQRNHHKAENSNKYLNKSGGYSKSLHTSTTYRKEGCVLCKKDNHVFASCKRFIDMDYSARRAAITRLNLCKLCLFNYGDSACRSMQTCRICNSAHHTLLHDFDFNKNVRQQGQRDYAQKQRKAYHASSGADTIQSALIAQQQLLMLLKGGGFNLRKWSANCPQLIEKLSADQIATTSMFDFKQEDSMKTLGVAWNPKTDMFLFNWELRGEVIEKITKRVLLSEISQLYDPLGWLAPITIAAKLVFQKVWLSESSWDDFLLPQELKEEWVRLRENLPKIKQIKIPRWVGSTRSKMQLHGFCDASEKAYACVVYSRLQGESGNVEITLIAAKTKVAPMKQKSTIPRLELCGALLLSNLMEKIRRGFPEKEVSVFGWCDSKVVLAWLQGESTKWERYVVNRVSKIKPVIPASGWQYVKSEENPADCASRGMTPENLVNFSLWWKGPKWLQDWDCQKIEKSCYITETGRVMKKHTTCIVVGQQGNIVQTLLEKYSSLTRLQRVMAWVLRFIHNLRHKECTFGYLTTIEMNASLDIIVRHVQQLTLADEYKQLVRNNIVERKSNIYKLDPFLDEKGIIRVGGRIQNSNLVYRMKKPIVLPHKGKFTQLVIEDAHYKTLHGGARLTLARIRYSFWIIRGNSAVKLQLRQCVRCHRFKATDYSQRMADLPEQRVTPSRPFTHTGVDFTGSVDVRLSKGRGIRTSKGYIAVFVCMATKAVHIELVSDLSTESFIGAFKRMCARRGVPRFCYSDNGTNFVGAARILKQEFVDFKKILTEEFFREISEMQVEWKFNAPAWPSAGGLWEAAVKSMKYHLKRVLGDQKLTYEEFITLLTQIEACMNSRPLCQLTEDPEEFDSYLTPGHFLTGSPNMLLPQRDYNEESSINIRKRWQLTEKMAQQYWKNWSSDYLTQLQVRSKWQRATANIKEGDIVLVKDNNLPPGKWALGRVMELHPGKDGIVRVTSLRTQNGILKRPIVKLSPLPKAECTLEIQDRNGNIGEKEQNEPEKNARTRSRRIRTKKSFGMMLLTMMVMMLAGITGTYAGENGADFRVTKIEKERPLYYDEIGKVQLIHDEWTLLVYYNLAPYWLGIRKMSDYLGHLKDVCFKMDPVLCNSTISQLEHDMEFLNYSNTILLSPQHLTARKKRGLINGVGYLANSLFGVLDERFAQKYEEDIQSIRENENYLMELQRNQTSIVEMENTQLRRSEERMNKQFRLLDNFVNQTNHNLEKVDDILAIMTIGNYFNSAALTASLLIDNLKMTQEIFFNTLTEINQGHMDKHLFNPNYLSKQLKNIGGMLPRTLSLPVDIANEIKDIYKLVYVKARVTENMFLFEVHIPLTSGDNFIAYRVIPLPVNINGQVRKIQPSSELIAVNFGKNTYMGMQENDMAKCIQRNRENYVCRETKAVYNLHNENAPCEAKIISHRPTLPCPMNLATCEDAWISLHKPNTWLSICCKECLLRIICDDRVTSYTAYGFGIVSLGQGCVLQGKESTLHSYNVFSNTLHMEDHFNVPTLDVVNNMVNKTIHTIDMPNIVELGNLSGINEVEQRTRYQKEREHFPFSGHMSFHDVHHYVAIYLVAGAAMICIIVWAVKRCNRQGAAALMARMATAAASRNGQDIELQQVSTANIAADTKSKATNLDFDFNKFKL